MDKDISEIQLACFSLEDKTFAVDIMRIKEILLPQKFSSLPTESTVLDGVINLRGTVIPVMNMRKRFQIASRPDEHQSKLLIVSLAKQLLGLMVDDVMEVITVKTQEIKPPVQVSSGVGIQFLAGVCLSGERVVMVLDIDSLLV